MIKKNKNNSEKNLKINKQNLTLKIYTFKP